MISNNNGPRYSALSLALAVAVACASACIDDEDRCGDSMRFDDGACVPIDGGADDGSAEAGAGDGAPAGDGSVDAETTDGGPADAGETGLGEPCKDDGACKGTADYCALQPGQTEGICTFKDCDPKDASTCPEGYTCFDLSVFDPSLPTFCNKG